MPLWYFLWKNLDSSISTIFGCPNSSKPPISIGCSSKSTSQTSRQKLHQSTIVWSSCAMCIMCNFTLGAVSAPTVNNIYYLLQCQVDSTHPSHLVFFSSLCTAIPGIVSFNQRFRNLTKWTLWDQKVDSDCTGLSGGFSGQRAWVHKIKKMGARQPFLSWFQTCPVAGTSALILNV
jgi:hypothetical protein